MKKILTKIIGASLAIAMMIGVGAGLNSNKRATEVHADSGYTIGWGTASGAAGTFTNFTAVSGSVTNVLSFTTSKNSSSTNPAYNSSSNELRLYYHSGGNGGSITIAPAAGITFTGFVMETSTTPSVKYSADGGAAVSVSASNNTYTASGISASTSLMIQNVNTTNTQLRIKTITISYTSSTGPVKENVELACDDLALDISDPATHLSVTATSGGNTVNGLAYSYQVANDSIATVSDTGYVTPKAIGQTDLTITFEGNEDYNSASITISVTVSDRTATISNLTFTAACGGSGTANDGIKWTVTSDGSESNFDNTSGIHYGTNNASVTYLQLSSTDLKGDIKKVVVNARDAQNTAAVSVSVGNTAFSCSGSATATNSSQDFTFTGNARGEVIVKIDRGTSMQKALYVKSVVVTYAKINLESIALSGEYQTTFNQGDTFNHDGMVVTATYDDDSNEDVTALAKWTGHNMANIGQQTITVTYMAKTAQYTINVVEATMYTITGSITNGSLSSEESVQENAALSITINANERYNRPNSLAVTMGDAPYNGYSYNSSTGAFSIEHVTGNVTITGECSKTHGYWPEDPFTVAEARELIDEKGTINGVYATGIVSEIVTPFDQEHGNISYNISSNGSSVIDQLQSYRGKGLNNQVFTSADDVKVGAIVVIYGNLKKHNSTYEFDSGNYLVSYESPTNEAVINAYKNSATSVATINGDEQRTSNVSMESIVFAELGLENGVQYLDPFDAGHFTITFAGGANDGKYYTTGTGIRTYKNGSFTIASDEDISKIELIWDGSNKPSTNVASVNTYNPSTNSWSGNAKSITFTKTDSDQWRLKAVYVTFGVFESVSNVKLRFGASIDVDKWNAINDLEDCEITDYGVMVFKVKEQYAETAPTVQSLYGTNPAYVEVFNKGSGVAPTAENGKYTFTARIDYTDDEEYSKYMIAQAFIVVNGTDYYFLGEEMRESVRSLASKANVETNLSSDALTYLTTAGK